jgi:hypothetical protein
LRAAGSAVINSGGTLAFILRLRGESEIGLSEHFFIAN